MPMPRKLISSGSPWESVAGYSRAVVQGDWCFVAGTTGYDPATRSMPDDFRTQVENAFLTVEAALTEAGFSLRDVVRVTYYVTDPGRFEQLAPLFGAKFGEIRPAATYLEVAGLASPEMKFEIEITALRRT
jgi:enamine deaminase RidA (YjgF/YER057c/UK114 family)